MSDTTNAQGNGSAQSPAATEGGKPQGLEQLKKAARELAEKKKQLNDTSTTRAVSVEGFVEDALAPQLKTWLNKHLPRVVEEIVRKEVRRITNECGL
jgi:cell pole-organizing protein PopZ